jgi:predicted RNA binding protein YcfA (HicA-like mRNA interferase family)
MVRLARITAEEVIKLLERVGFSLVRQSGSHKIYKHAKGERVAAPYHAWRESAWPCGDGRAAEKIMGISSTLMLNSIQLVIILVLLGKRDDTKNQNFQKATTPFIDGIGILRPPAYGDCFFVG